MHNGMKAAPVIRKLWSRLARAPWSPSSSKTALRAGRHAQTAGDVCREGARPCPRPTRTLPISIFDVPVTEAERGKPARRLLKPMVLAKLVQAAAVEAGDHVLDVGCASGYSSALLARLARSVIALEEDEALVRLARENLKAVSSRPRVHRRQSCGIQNRGCVSRLWPVGRIAPRGGLA
jgi:2-polyprenyl-3-methyl-5-hydroxy-6-metoxy-1,4-benzoquinol methylase